MNELFHSEAPELSEGAGTEPSSQLAASTLALALLPVPAQDSGDADRIIDSVVAKIRRFGEISSFLQQRGRKAAYETLGSLYVISMQAKEDDGFRARLMQRAHIRVRTDTPHHLAVIRGFLNLAGIRVPKSTVNDWSKALRACEYRNVEPSIAAVRRWLDEPEYFPNYDAILSGYDKADVVVELCEVRTKNNREHEPMKRWLAYKETRRASPIATIPLTGKIASISKGYVLLLAHLDHEQMIIMDEFETDQSRIRAQVLKKCA